MPHSLVVAAETVDGAAVPIDAAMRRNAPCPKPPKPPARTDPQGADAPPPGHDGDSDAGEAVPAVPAALCGASASTRHFLAVYDTAGHLLARTASPHDGPIRAIEAALGVPEGEYTRPPRTGLASPPRVALLPDPVLFTVGEDGSVAVHNITVWKEGSLLTGRPSLVSAEGEHQGGQSASAACVWRSLGQSH